MHTISPDILVETRGLSGGAAIIGLVIGLLLWVTGWTLHRFWVVIAITVGGGLYGLMNAGSGNVIVMGLLLAVAAGLLAIELARIFAFVAGGTAVWLAAGAMFPAAQELWVVFLAGGLAGIVFYRIWTMAITSFIGVVVAGHSILVLVELTSKLDASAWAETNSLMLSIVVGLASALGLAIQGMIHRWAVRRRAERDLPSKDAEAERREINSELQALKDLIAKKG
jgi:hypothetical protein